MKKAIFVLYSLLFITGLVVPQTIKKIMPSGGNIITNSPISIQWLALGTKNKFKVILLRNGVKVGVIQNDVDAGNGLRSIPWEVGKYMRGKAQLGPGYKIRVKEKNASTAGMSAKPFKIVGNLTIKSMPLIQQMFTAPLGALKMESQLYINGIDFGTKKGDILMYGNFPQNPVYLVDVHWVSSKKVNGKVPVFNTTGLPDQEVEIRVKTADNVLSNARQIGYVGRKEQKILQKSDVVVLQCGDDGNSNACNSYDHAEPPGLAITGYHRNKWGTIGDDVGDDIFQISLKNGWVLKSMKIVVWHKTSEDEVITGPNPPFPVGAVNWTTAIHWVASPNDHVFYGMRIRVEGPLGTHYK